MTPLKSRIRVLQYMSGDFEYFHWSEKINRAYCDRHGYKYVISRETPRTDRHVCWQKIASVIPALHDCDYLLVVDADAHFYSHELTIETELLPLMKDKSILMSADIGSETERWGPEKPNAGVILTKNNPQTLEFFRAWDQASDVDESYRWQWPPDQRALWDVVLPKYPELVMTHPDYYMIHGRYGQYIRHYFLSSDEERTEKMKRFCQSRNGEP